MDVKAFHVTISLMLAAVAWIGCGFIGIAYLSRGWRERDKRARAVGLLWFVVPTLIMAVWTWPHIAYLWTEYQWRAHFSNPDGDPAGYEKVFERMLLMRWQVFGIYFGVGFAFLFFNLLIARFICRLRGDIEHWAVKQSRLMHWLLTAACAVASGMLAFIVMWQWESYWNAEAYDKEGVGRVQAIVQHQPALFGTPDSSATAAPWTDDSELKAFTEEMEAALEARFADNPNVLFLGVDGQEKTGAKHAPEPPHYFLRGFLSVAPDGKSFGNSIDLQLTGRTVLERDPTRPRISDKSHKPRISFKPKKTKKEKEKDGGEMDRAAALDLLTENAAASKYLKDGFCDPIFHKNVGYYLFRFPRTRYESMWILAVLFAALGLIAYQYRYYYHRDAHSMPRALKGIGAQGTLLWILILGASAWKADVDRQSMLYLDPLINLNMSKSNSSVDYFYVLQSDLSEIYIGALAVLAFALLVNVVWQNRRLWWWVAIGWASSYLLILWAYPTVYNFAIIKANKLEYVSPYLEKHIAMTRRGFKLDAIQKNPLIQETATMQDVLERPEVLSNVQLWDRVTAWEWIDSDHVFNLPSHTFHKYMDVDRYQVDGEIRQLLLGVRELDPIYRSTELEWWTKRLDYTHGYGIVAAPVNETNKDRPKIWGDNTFDIERKEVYYGELNNDYVFVGASKDEFSLNITKSNEVKQINRRYDGQGGVEIGQGLERWAWATRLLSPLRIGLSKKLDAGSRVLLHRHVQNRAGILAPFLKFDPDPYIVIGEDNKKLWWVIDVYTATGRYPYSEQRRALNIEGQPILDLGGGMHSEPDIKGFNYIRNSVVAVVDPYHGDVFFYVTDPHDPLIKMYQHHFGELFQPIEEMPPEIKTHLRYPDYLLWTQASMYGRYHVDDAKTFQRAYEQWGIPHELIYNPHKKENNKQAMMPYYTVLTLPGLDKPEFVSVLPMAPKKKASRRLLSAWLVARCDGEHYGDLVCYTLPKSSEEDLEGPIGIENRIIEKMTEKREFEETKSLKITRGSLLLLPIQTRSGNTALIYVEPVYSQPWTENEDEKESEPGKPTLKAVFVSAGGEIRYDPSFQEALDKTLRAGLNASIKGVVSNADGTPILGVGVQIADKDGTIMEEHGLFTKLDGVFEVKQLEAGENYTLHFGKSGLEEKSVSITTLLGKETTRNVTMSPPAPEKQERTLSDMILSAKQQIDLYKNSTAGLTQLESDVNQLIQDARSKNNIGIQRLAMSANAALENYKQSKKEALHAAAGEHFAQLEADIEDIFKIVNEAAANGES